MIVFDFDKTLTDKDTLFGFYRTVSSDHRYLFFVKRLCLLLVAILYKSGVVSNTYLKKTGIYLFLKGKTRDEIKCAAKVYSNQILLNDIYQTIFLNTEKSKRIIITASLSVYLEFLFPDEKLFASELSYNINNRVSGLLVNMYGKNKYKVLKESGIIEIESVYTDSYADAPLIKASEQAFWVNNNKVTKIK